MSIWRSHVTIAHSSLGGIGTNSWTFRADDPLIGGEHDAPAGWIQTFYETLNSVLASGTLISHDGQWNRVDGEESLEFSDPFSVGITGAAGVLPPSQCMVVGWSTSSPTRGGRGRTFCGPLKLDTLEDNGTPNEAHRATVKAAADALIESSDTFANGALGIWSEDPSGTPPDPVFRDFIGAKVSNKFSVLRSRRD